MKRRTVHKITPSGRHSFDQQFWPVLVALTVLGGIALGAVLTILRGPWMWGSLLILPLLAALAIFLLFNLNDNRLRRSLQFAIITSLALHLLVLVVASVINIFQNPYKPEERQVAQRPNRTIEISDTRAAFVWEETNAQQTPEPEVTTERQQQPTTNAKPQPVPVVETKPEINPQLVRRESTTPSVPRQNRELSQLRRQTQNLKPQSSQRTTGEKVAETKTSPAEASAEQQAEASQQADSIARQSAPQPDPAPEPQKNSAAPDSNSKPEIVKASSSPRQTRSSETPAQSLPPPTPSSARVSRPQPKLPVASTQAPVTNNVATTATTTQPAKSEPAKSSSELTRRPVESQTDRPAFNNRPQTELSPRPQIAKSVQRKSEPQTLPSISSSTSVTITPRRSTTESAVASSPVQIEKPARAPESKTASRELNSKTLSVSRSTAGVAGVGRAKNLERFTGGINSPASRASDSARRERTTSSQSDPRMLTSSQKSPSRRSVGATRVPTSAFRSETSAAAKIAGAKTPGERTLESSAASLDAASTESRDEVSAERGSATVDLGATKIVTDRQSLRRSGGGQPEVSRLNPESTRRSKDRSRSQPSLVASSDSDVAAPRSQSTAPPSTNALEASDRSAFASREGGTSPTTVERWSAATKGKLADQGESNLAEQLSDSRQRARSSSDESSWNDEEDDEDEENKRGNARTRIAQSPVTRADPGFGTAENEAVAAVAAKNDGDGPTESVATLVSRQATASVPGSGIGRAATNALLQAATSLPIIDAAPNRRAGTGTSTTADPDASSGMATNNRKPRGSRSTESSATPTITDLAMTESPAVSHAGSADRANLDSVQVEISKSDLAALEQDQGSELEIDAPEGPAGLATRPDDFIGVMTRPASRESEQLLPEMKNRFRSNRFGGVPAINPDAVIAKEAFRDRSPAALASASEPTTEAAIHLGLEFLARYQSPDGSWALIGFDRDEPQHLTQLDSDTAATGLALLAFQGAGYNHREFKYARQINHAIQWLIENQGDDGGLYVPADKKSDSACRLYSHGIAALALTEAYGMTQDARLKEPAQKALDYITNSQDPRKGGWRYFHEPGKKSSDTSVTGWMMMAMQSGRLAGLEVDEQAFTLVDDWLEVAADPDNNSLYRYNPYAKDSKGVSRMQGRKPTASMTSVGLLMRIYAGWDRDDPRLLAGADYLLEQQLPSDSTPQVRDTYYWYYATQVLKHIDGPRWEKWNQQLRPLLTRSQEKSGDLAGSWHPYQPVPDRWGSFGGRLYVTTMNLLSLEVRHRMLPLYQQNDGKPASNAPVIEGQIETTEQVSANMTPVRPFKPNDWIVVDRPTEPTEDLTADVDMKSDRENSILVRKPAMEFDDFTVVNKPNTGQQPVHAEKDTLKIELTKSVTSPTTINENVARKMLTEPKRTRSTNAPMTAPKIVATMPEPLRVADSNPSELVDDSDLRFDKPELANQQNVEKSAIVKPDLRIRPAVMPDDIESGAGTGIARIEPESNLDSSNTLKRSRSSNSNKPTIKPPAPTISAKPEVPLTSVSGTVTLAGKILSNAKVEFIPLEKTGKRVSLRTNASGQFGIAAPGVNSKTGIRAGKYMVSVTTFVESKDVDQIDYLETVPAKYNSETTLRVTISADKPNSIRIDLKK